MSQTSSKTADLPDILKKSLPFWPHLDETERRNLILGSSLDHYSKNSFLYCGFGDCAGVLIIRSGGIRAYILSEDGREITLYRLYEGDICVLSASCVLREITFKVHIDAIADCEIVRITSPVFSQLSSQNIYVESFIHKLATERFSDVMWTMQQILFMSFDRRLAIFLTDEAEKSNGDVIFMTHEQIARYMGSAREVVSRMLKYFSQEGLVKLTRGGVELLDKKKLRELAR